MLSPATRNTLFFYNLGHSFQEPWGLNLGPWSPRGGLSLRGRHLSSRGWRLGVLLLFYCYCFLLLFYNLGRSFQEPWGPNLGTWSPRGGLSLRGRHLSLRGWRLGAFYCFSIAIAFYCFGTIWGTHVRSLGDQIWAVGPQGEG